MKQTIHCPVIFFTLCCTIFAKPASAQTNHNLSPDSMVTLVGNNTADASGYLCRYLRVTMDGTMTNSRFEIPKGYVLVVTDIAWRGKTVNPKDYTTITFQLLAKNKDSTLTAKNVVFESYFSSPPNNGSTSGKSEHFTTGLVVSSKAELCATSHADISHSASAGNVTHALEKVILNGYLQKVPSTGGFSAVKDKEKPSAKKEDGMKKSGTVKSN